jgi:probable F420-dependent oxidoreductase
VQIGVVYPQIELGGDPTAVRRFGRAVERLGFDYLLAYDHVLGAVHAGWAPRLTGPYAERDPFHDPFVMFAYLAGLTERIGFATGVLILPQRQTALVARQAADVDLLSGGRLRLGVGVGWSPVEYEALGQDFGSRGARQEEQIELLRRLFTDPVVDFAGRFDRVDRAALLPKPTRPVPIWLGGSSDKAFDRAARLGDGFFFLGGGIHPAADAWASGPGPGAQARPIGRRRVCGAALGRDRRTHRGHRRVATGRRDTPVHRDHGPRPGLRRRAHRPPLHTRGPTPPTMTPQRRHFPARLRPDRLGNRGATHTPTAGNASLSRE